MSTKKRASLYDTMAEQETEAPAGAQVVTLAPAPKATNKTEKATVYLPRAAHKRLKLMAIEHDKRVNDFLQEGVDLMLKQYGQPSLKEFEEQ